jgi:ribose transport system substrate-binding protein
MAQTRWKVSACFLAALVIVGPVRAQETISPNGEKPAGSDQLKLSDDDLKALKAGKFKAALLWHVQSDFMAAVAQGAKDELKALGIDVVAETDANLDAAKQQNDVETVMAKAPNMIITIPLDPVASAATFAQPRDKGVKLSFLAAVPKDYKAGKDYVALTTDDLFHDGEKAADALAKAIGGKGEIGYIYFDANLYVPNERDKAFKYTIEHKYPDIKIVATQGIVDPLKAQEAADAFLLKHPNLDGIYVTWVQPAEYVLAALRNAKNTHTKLVAIDLSEAAAVDMVKGGNVVALIADDGYAYGKAGALVGAMGLLNKSNVPPYTVIPSITATKDNIKEAWETTLQQPLPKSVSDAMK